MDATLAIDAIHPLPDAVQALCRAHGVTRPAVFGSRLEGTARADSDLDLLVQFAPDRVPGLLGLAELEAVLGQAIGLQVDLRTPQDLSPLFRDEVLRTARTAYAA